MFTSNPISCSSVGDSLGHRSSTRRPCVRTTRSLLTLVLTVGRVQPVGRTGSHILSRPIFQLGIGLARIRTRTRSRHSRERCALASYERRREFRTAINTTTPVCLCFCIYSAFGKADGCALFDVGPHLENELSVEEIKDLLCKCNKTVERISSVRSTRAGRSPDGHFLLFRHVALACMETHPVNDALI